MNNSVQLSIAVSADTACKAFETVLGEWLEEQHSWLEEWYSETASELATNVSLTKSSIALWKRRRVMLVSLSLIWRHIDVSAEIRVSLEPIGTTSDRKKWERWLALLLKHDFEIRFSEREALNLGINPADVRLYISRSLDEVYHRFIDVLVYDMDTTEFDGVEQIVSSLFGSVSKRRKRAAV